MSIRIDPDRPDPTPRLGPSELDNGIMNMRVLAGLIAFVMFLVFVAAAISAVLWLVLR
jgi:hypothetical protein